MLKITFCTYFKNIDEFRFQSETYAEYTAFCLKSGSFSYKIGSDSSKILSEGEIVICPPNQPFQREIIESCELLMIKLISAEDISFSSKSVKCADIMRLNYDLEKLEECLFCYDMENYPQFEHYSKDIIYLAKDSAENRTVFCDVKNYMENNYNEKISIAMLAKKTGYSTAQFINIFKKNFGCTPKQYIAQIRINKAKEALLTSNMLSKEVAYECGFGDELYFIRFFKKYTGLTPMQFKKQARYP